jgi:hypothetical protein
MQFYNGKLIRVTIDRTAGITRIEISLTDGVRLTLYSDGRVGNALARVRLGTYIRAQVDLDVDPERIVAFWVA